MTENEQLARWLGWTSCLRCGPNDAPCNFMMNGDVLHHIPDFRTDNDWAGALLEKLPGFTFDKSSKGVFYLNVPVHSVAVTAGSWRDAVVDATLEVICCEFSSTGEKS